MADRLITGLVIAAGVGISAVSWLQPWFADDYVVAVSLSKHPGIVDFVLHWYTAWSGRATASAFIWLSQTSRPLFAVLVGGSLLLSAYLVVAAGLGRVLRPDSRNIALCALALTVLWFGTPALGEVAVWHTGSSTYLMTIPLTLGFLLPFRIALGSSSRPEHRGRDLLLAVPMAVLGAALGLSQGSAIAGTVVVLVVMLAVAIRRRLVRRLPLYLWAGALGLVAGGVLMLAAPGTAVRAAHQSAVAPSLLGLVPGAPGSVTSLVGRLAYFGFVVGRGGAFVLPAIIPWLLVVVLLAAPARAGAARPHSEHETWWRWPVVWLVGAAATMLPFAVIPYPGGGRIHAFGFVFLVLCVFSLFPHDRSATLDVLPKRLIALGVSLLLIIMLAELGGSLLVQRRFQAELASRERLIAESVARGQKDVVVPKLVIQQHRAVPYDDITSDPKDWRNVAVAEWYGLRSIRLGDTASSK